MNNLTSQETKIIHLLRKLPQKDEVRIIKNGNDKYLVIETRKVLLDARFIDLDDR